MVLILNHKYYFFIYIFSQSCFSGSENDSYLGMERVGDKLHISVALSSNLYFLLKK